MRTNIWSESLKGKDYSEDLGVDGKVISEWILEKCGGKVWTRCVWLRIGTSGGKVSIRGGKFFD
jgi:hypothetical protein